MNNNLIIFDTDGNRTVHTVSDGLKLDIQKGDRIVASDSAGNPVMAQLVREGDNLILNFGGQDKGAEQVTLRGFHTFAKSDVDLQMGAPASEIRDASDQNELFDFGDKYDINPVLGSLPLGDDFTLMRFSSVGFTEFIDNLNAFRSEVRAALRPNPADSDPYLPSGGAPFTDEPVVEGNTTIINRPTTIIRPPAISNTPPNAVNDVATIDEDAGPVSIDVLVNDSDRESPVRVINVLPTIGTATILPNGEIEYEAPADFSGTDIVTYSIVDSDGNTDIATVTVTVNPTDDPPVANPDEESSDPATPVFLNILEDDSDPDGQEIELIAVQEPNRGSVVFTPDGGLTFDPEDDFLFLGEGETATETFEYTITDPDGNTDISTVTITITGENDPPIANPDTLTVGEDAPAILDPTGNDTDPDGDPVEICGIVDANGTMVNPTEGIPIVLASGATVTLLDDRTLDYQQNGVFDSLDEGESAIDVFTYKIDDGNGGTATSTFSVTITGADDPTDARPDSETTLEDTPVSGNVLTNDSDPDTNDNPLSVASNTPPSNGTVIVNPDGSYTYTPEENFIGEDTFTYTTDTGVTETVTITVTPVNDPPVANPDTATVPEDGPAILDPIGNDTDPDSDPVQICGIVDANGTMVTPVVGTPIILASGATVTLLNDGTLDYQQNGIFDSLDDGETGSDVFTYKIDDGNGGTATSTFTITIDGADDPTDAQPDAETTPEDTPVSGNVLTNDSDPDTNDNPLTVASNTSPSNGTVIVNPDGSYTYTPEENFIGEDTFTYTTDTGVTETVTITVTPVNDPPIANPDTATIDEDGPAILNPIGNDTDPDGDPVQICGIVDANGTMVTPVVGTPIVLASGASVTLLNDGTLDYQQNGIFDSLDDGETGSDVFTYKIDDGNGGTATSTFTITIDGADDPTDAQPDAETTPEDTPVSGNVLTNDSDPDTNDNPLSVASNTPPSNGSVIVNPDGSYTYTPNENFIGEDTFTYTTDTGVTETVTITVTPVNDPPVAQNGSGTVEQPLTYSDCSQVPPVNFEDGELFAGDGLTAGTKMLYRDASTGIDVVIEIVNGAVSEFDDPVAGTASHFQPQISNSVVDFKFSFFEAGTYDTVTQTGTPAVIPEIGGGSIDVDGGVETVGYLDPSSYAVNDPTTLNHTVDPDGYHAFTNTGANQDSIGFGGEYVAYFHYDDVSEINIRMEATAANRQFSMTLDPCLHQNFGDSTITTLSSIENFDMLASASDPEGDTLTISHLDGQVATLNNVITLASGATVMLKPDGTVDYDTKGVFGEAAALDSFEYTITDGNGGSATATFSVNVNPVFIAPVVIDLDGDGVEFDGTAEGIEFDVDGDGELEQTAWADEDDAVLIYDYNEDGNVTESDEFVFTGYTEGAKTDLEGLAFFDSDGDGTLDGNDAEFSKFKLWQDSNGNGTVDEGELQSLSAHGVESIDLISDGQSYSAANGDVQVHGEANVNYTDGTVGIAADASFAFAEAALNSMEDEAPIEIATPSGEILTMDQAPPTPIGLEIQPVEIESGANSPTISIDDQVAIDAAMIA